MKVTLMMCFNLSMLQLYQIYKNQKAKKYKNQKSTKYEKGSEWIIDSVIEHNISISKYNPLAESSYIKLQKELDHPRKGLINIQNIDNNECFKCSIVTYLNLTDHNQGRITKVDQDFAKKLDFKYIKFPVKIRDIHQIGKKNSIGISAFGYENKEKHSIYVLKIL